MAKSKKVSSLIEEKRKISKEIESLQNKCIHLQKSIKSIREDEASTSTVIRRVCENCKKVLGVPTQQEIFDFLNNG